MRRSLGWMMVVLLCCAADAMAGEEQPDPRLQEAQKAFDEASALQSAGKFAEAIAKGEHALALREAVLGGMHPDVAASLNRLANSYKAQGLFDRAMPLQARSLAIREAVLGKDHPDVAASLNGLANLYRVQGLYGQAEPLYQRALAIREAALGKKHPTIAQGLNNLALLYVEQGSYAQAEPLYERALAIQEEALGKHHPDIAVLLNNLANLYSSQGLLERTVPLHERALAIREKAFGPNHPDVGHSLNNLAIIYQQHGMYDRAVPLYERARSIWEATLGEQHPTVTSVLVNLAITYTDQGRYDQAEPLYERVIAIREAGLDKHHPLLASAFLNFAILHMARERYDRAGPLLERALAIQEAALGKHHPEVAPTLSILAQLRLAQGRLAEAVLLFTRAFTISEQRLRQEALGFSEQRLTGFLQYLRRDEERLYTLLHAHPGNARIRRLALTAALLLKGRSVEETANISRTIYRSLDAQDRDTFERLRGLRAQLASLSFQGPGSQPLPAYQQRLKELTKEGDALEATLARRSASLRALAALPSPADIVDRVATALPKNGALVELITYEDSPFALKPGAPTAQGLYGEPRYLALVLFPNATLRVVDLGPAGPIDLAASRLRDALANRDVAFQPHAQALYQLAFQPLLPVLGKTRRLFISPDGQLALVPFAALHDGQQFLVDTFNFTYLTSGKDLLPRAQVKESAASVVVFADPDFNAPLQASASPERSTSIERFLSTLSTDPAHRAWNTVPLPGTRREAESIQRLLPQAQLFLGSDASKERLLQLPPPGILHLATHGFFLGDAQAAPGSRSVGQFGALGEDPAASRPPDPLLRSGLLLAGAHAPAPDDSSPGLAPPESAVMTALELSGLDLWGTQLVVMSACDTGRGDVKQGQGVYGLRRALVVAGAETVVMSLWQVKDDTTQQLMEAYYRNLLAGQGRATALNEAMRWLRATQPHPHAWAPFIALGRDTPLRGLLPEPKEAPL
jgi:CHAT domain-containing protein/tetratricopeptide (TPR) repeat protein